jgi:hypothetical protein
MAAHVHITPEESRAIARFFVAAIRILTRPGFGWGALAVLGALGAGWAAWTLPSWWGSFRDWLDE